MEFLGKGVVVALSAARQGGYWVSIEPEGRLRGGSPAGHERAVCAFRASVDNVDLLRVGQVVEFSGTVLPYRSSYKDKFGKPKDLQDTEWSLVSVEAVDGT